MAFQKVPSEFIRKSGGGLQDMLLRRTEYVMQGIQGVMLTRDADAIIAWGTQIELLGSFVQVYVLTDADLEGQLDATSKHVDRYYSRRMSPEGRKEIYNAYRDLFRMVTKKLKKFSLYPPLSVGYVQGMGEITEDNPWPTQKPQASQKTPS